MSRIDLAFSINNNYTEALCIVIYSLAVNNRNNKFSISVLHTELTDSNKKQIKNLSKLFDNIKITFIKLDRTMFEHLPIPSHLTVETYYRYVLADVLPNLSKVLYLDADIIVTKNIKKLWETDISRYYIAAVKDLYVKSLPDRKEYMKSIGMRASDEYVNAGVLLLNLENIRKDNIVKKLFTNSIKLSKFSRFGDQDVINSTLISQTKPLNSAYNTFAGSPPEKFSSAAIIHFTSKYKPWITNSYQYRIFYSEWYKYEYKYYKTLKKLSASKYINRQDSEKAGLHERITFLEEKLKKEREDFNKSLDNPSVSTSLSMLKKSLKNKIIKAVE